MEEPIENNFTQLDSELPIDALLQSCRDKLREQQNHIFRNDVKLHPFTCIIKSDTDVEL